MLDIADLYPEVIWPYDPRLVPQAPPDVDICAGPVVNICLNVQWWAHVSGVIARLAYRDAWKGTDDQISDAVESIYKILDVGRPTMSCGCGCGGSGLPSRFNADGVYQVSYDGGITWVDAPEGDYRNTVTLAPPLPGDNGNTKKCQAAANIRFHVKTNGDQLGADANFWANVTLLIGGLVALLIFVEIIGTLGIATPLILAAAGGLLTVGQSGFVAAMTSGVYDTFQCIVYCHMQSDGSFTDADMSAISADINSQLTGTAAIYLDLFVVRALGAKGFTNMGRTGGATDADCSACDCGEKTCVETFSIYPSEAGYFGHIINVNAEEGWMEVETTNINVNNLYYISIQTDADNKCCIYSGADVLEGGGVPGPAWADCNGSRLSFSSGIIGTSRCVNAVQWASGAPYRLKVYFVPCAP